MRSSGDLRGVGGVTSACERAGSRWRSRAGFGARGFTVIELAVVLVVCVLVGLVVMPLLSRSGGCRGCRPLKDSTQVRGILQGMVIFAGNNKDQYPLPSVLDAQDATVAEAGPPKDTTANIFSILIYQGSIPVDMGVSPAEVNPAITVMDGYEFTSPKAAVKPAEAQWDPAFSADFTTGKGNWSYGHQLPAGPRLATWANTFNALEAVVGNRGPEIAGVTKGRAPGVKIRTKIPNSNTLLIHGGPSTWEGNIGYNDNHVNFETTMMPTMSGGSWVGARYKDAAGVAWDDVIFYDEPDDVSGKNAYLGIFTKAGKTKDEFKAIWD